MRSTISTCSVQRDARELYELLSHAQGPAGPLRTTFTGYNEFGVMDHWVDLGEGRVVYVPMRIISNGDGSGVMRTLFQFPGMSDEKFAEDEPWVRRDFIAGARDGAFLGYGVASKGTERLISI